MPTIIRKAGFSFKIYTNDHEPMHVHAFYQGNEVTINFTDESVSIRENRGLNRIRVQRAMRVVFENRRLLIEKWREIYE